MSRLTLIKFVLASCVLGFAALAAAKTVEFKVPGGELKAALDTYVKQAGVQLVYREADVKDVQTKGVNGELPLEEALTRILEGTQLMAHRDSSGAIAIVAGAAKAEAGEAISPSLRLAQNEKAGPEVSPADPHKDSQDKLQEIVVTGSHIRGTAPAGSKIIEIKGEDIRNSGYSRFEDYLATLPQNFKGTSEEFNPGNDGNSNRGSEIQLRGLGNGTTLTLVNGRRMPAGGATGLFTDISGIPTAAIERVEILPDGASAIYGSDAIGGVVNIILRKDFQGTESSLRLATAEGERDEVQFSLVSGTHWGRGSIIGGYQYMDLGELSATERAYSATNGDLRAFGGTDFRQSLARFATNPGVILCPATGFTTCTPNQPAYLIPSNQTGSPRLTVGQLIPVTPANIRYTDTAAATWLLPRQEQHSVFFNASQFLTDNWEVFLDGRFSTRKYHAHSGPVPFTVTVLPASPFYVNPFPGTPSVRVAYDFTSDIGPIALSSTTKTYAAGAGAIGKIGGDWRLKLDAYHVQDTMRFDSYGLNGSSVNAAASQNNTAALNVFGDGSNTSAATLATILIHATSAHSAKNQYASAIADGPLFSLPGGAAQLAIGADYRTEGFEAGSASVGTNGAVFGDVNAQPSANREVIAFFSELSLPMIGPNNNLPGVHRLEASIAARYEDYSDFGSTFDPKIGLSYMPLQSLRLRGTWGTSFRAPPVGNTNVELNPASGGRFGPIADPASPTNSSLVVRIFGNNEGLTEETATVWTAGFDWEPALVPNFSASVSYYDIDYQDKIQSNSPTLTEEAQWAELITRNPTQAQLDAVCSQLPAGACSGGPFAAILDFRVRNTAVVKTSGVDLDLAQSFDTAYGRWSLGLGGNKTFEFNQALTSTAPEFDLIDTLAKPVDLRIQGSISWSRDGLNVGATVNYVDDYHVSAINLTSVSSWTTLDVRAGYRMPASSSWLENLQLNVAIVNATNELPPFVNQVQGYNSASSTILGRLTSIQLSKQWGRR